MHVDFILILKRDYDKLTFGYNVENNLIKLFFKASQTNVQTTLQNDLAE